MNRDNGKLLAPILEQLRYWMEPGGSGDAWRAAHDRDCVLTGGNLYADTIFSLWLPLRYTLDFFAQPAWAKWRKYAKENGIRLKEHAPFLTEMIDHPERFLDLNSPITAQLSRLFTLGVTRTNVMILPQRSWNSERGVRFSDYLPAFLHKKFSVCDPVQLKAWICRECLQPLFAEGILEQARIKDIAGTGDPRRHDPGSIHVEVLLKSYIEFLEERQRLMDTAA